MRVALGQRDGNRESSNAPAMHSVMCCDMTHYRGSPATKSWPGPLVNAPKPPTAVRRMKNASKDKPHLAVRHHDLSMPTLSFVTDHCAPRAVDATAQVTHAAHSHLDIVSVYRMDRLSCTIGSAGCTMICHEAEGWYGGYEVAMAHRRMRFVS